MRYILSPQPRARWRAGKKLVQRYGVEAVLDVGANAGQYARELRVDLGYAGEIISFEPLAAAFEELQRACRGDAHWRAINCALGARSELRSINVAANSVSSSLLDMLPRHRDAAPESRYIGEARIEVHTLDSLFDRLLPAPTPKEIYLKIDTQGFEREVLHGAADSLQRIRTVQLELSLVPLYRGAPLLGEMCELMQKAGYTLVSLEAGFVDPESGQVLQADGIFRRIPG
jgi:FkbM family methyltransferase